VTELDEDRLEQLVGVHSSKTGYYARWRGAERRAAELTRRNEQLRRAREHLARVRQAELVNAERHRIARDLHDSVAQCLVGIGMHLEWCHRHLDPGSPAYERLVASKELARAGLGWVRSAVEELSGLEQPGTGLGQALRDLAADFRSAGQLRVSVRVTARQRQLPSAVEHSLFQIAQEGLWNAVRHAHATQAWLSLAYTEDQILLSVSDDGSGDPAVVGRYLSAVSASTVSASTVSASTVSASTVSASTVSAGPGTPRRGRVSPRNHGLRNIAERTAELGGKVRVTRRRGGGLRVSVRVPVEATRSAVPGAGS